MQKHAIDYAGRGRGESDLPMKTKDALHLSRGHLGRRQQQHR
jgi:hypothetical protein